MQSLKISISMPYLVTLCYALSWPDGLFGLISKLLRQGDEQMPLGNFGKHIEVDTLLLVLRHVCVLVCVGQGKCQMMWQCAGLMLYLYALSA